MTADHPTNNLMAQAQKAFADAFAGIIKLMPDGHAPVWIDGRTGKSLASADEPKGHAPDCVWRGAPDALLQALESEKALESAYLSGRVFISGDMSVMTRLTMATKR